ncbi:hypothetical protein PoB_001076400 [Plakobranchus ocellatus]|uniref:SMB domain-containing protein n=1 Tax=Plakobranchus ocellatus TaxID=259542 RepID=A0AAV3YQ55_9GAST|nr:hypothetical protein PoB_001076400 [Plakobranchus ocellatus]
MQKTNLEFWASRTETNTWSTYSGPLATATVPYQSISSEQCEQMAHEYVYKENLCKAPDPATYLIVAKAQYSCKDRCGIVPEYGRDFYECACDEVCIPYKDCCKDFSIACPTVHATGQAIYSELAGKVVPVCYNKYFKVLAKRRSKNNDGVTEATTQSAKRAVRADYSKANGNKFLWLGTKLINFMFGDHSSKLLFFNLNTFRMSKPLVSNPFVIPEILSASCSFHDIQSIINIADTCEAIDRTHVITALHRNCKMNQILSCSCGDRNSYRQHLHNICLGFNTSISTINRYKLMYFQTNFFSRPEKEQCRLHKYTESWHTQLVSGHQTRRRKHEVKMIIRPIIKSLSEVSQYDKTAGRENDADNKENIKEVNGYVARDLINDENADYQYIIELENTLEKRLRCPTLDRFLTDCQLEECTHGAIISDISVKVGQFGNDSCIVPKFATVYAASRQTHVLLCSCLRVMAAIKALKIWTVKILNVGLRGQCHFSLSLIPAEPDSGQEMRLSLIEATKPTFETRLQQQFRKTSAFCSEENGNQGDLQLSFFTLSEKLRGDTSPSATFMLFSSQDFRITWGYLATVTLTATHSKPVFIRSRTSEILTVPPLNILPAATTTVILTASSCQSPTTTMALIAISSQTPPAVKIESPKASGDQCFQGPLAAATNDSDNGIESRERRETLAIGSRL